MRFGVVAEGVSDFLILQAVVGIVDPDIELQRLQPDTTLVSGFPNGWKGVRAWCQENGGKLKALLRGVKGQELDGLIVHADCSMADKVEAERACPPASDTADALRSVMESWLGLSPLPPWLVLATPSMTSVTWIVAALDPSYEPTCEHIECDLKAEDELKKRKLVRVRNGSVKSPKRVFPPLLAEMCSRWEEVKGLCTEAARCESELSQAVEAVRSGNGP